MTKKKIEKMQKEYSKPQITRWERQRKIQKYIFFSGIGLIIAVLLLVGSGWYFNEIAPLNKTIVQVNNKNIKMIDCIKLLRANLAYGTFSEASTGIYYVIQDLTTIEVIRQGAAKIGVVATKDDIDSSLKDNGLTKDWAQTGEYYLLNKRLQDYFAAQIPTTADQVNIEAIFVDSESEANEIRNKITSLPDTEQSTKFDELASNVSLDSYSKTNKGEIGVHVQDALNSLLSSNIPGEYAFSNDKDQFSQPISDASKTKSIGYWIIKVLEIGSGENQGKINVQAMLLGNIDEANQVKTRLVNGEDFTAIAKELSQDTSSKESGGALGFISEGTISDAFDNAIFGLSINTVSDPIKDETRNGYWILEVLEEGTGDNSGKIHVQGILLYSLEDAQKVKTRLDSEEFAAVAKETSLYEGNKEQGGDFGFVARGSMGEAFDLAVFGLKSGIVSDPVKDTAQTTSGGFWLIKIVDKVANETVSAEDISTITNKKYDDWYANEYKNSTINTVITDDLMVWAVQEVTED
jgi:parvulin-like peptidyl-prolyl isomerase